MITIKGQRKNLKELSITLEREINTNQKILLPVEPFLDRDIPIIEKLFFVLCEIFLQAGKEISSNGFGDFIELKKDTIRRNMNNFVTRGAWQKYFNATFNSSTRFYNLPDILEYSNKWFATQTNINYTGRMTERQARQMKKYLEENRYYNNYTLSTLIEKTNARNYSELLQALEYATRRGFKSKEDNPLGYLITCIDRKTGNFKYKEIFERAVEKPVTKKELKKKTNKDFIYVIDAKHLKQLKEESLLGYNSGVYYCISRIESKFRNRNVENYLRDKNIPFVKKTLPEEERELIIELHSPKQKIDFSFLGNRKTTTLELLTNKKLKGNTA